MSEPQSPTVPPTIAVNAKSQAEFFRMLWMWYDRNVLKKDPHRHGQQMRLTMFSMGQSTKKREVT